jgi:hypothetical protein
MSDALKNSITAARVILWRLPVVAALSAIASLVLWFFSALAAALVLAGLFLCCFVTSIWVAHKVSDLAEVAMIRLRPRDRVKVLRVRGRLGGRSGIEPLSREEIEELCVLEAGLEALEDGTFKP